jgi:hypothetical protein
MPYEKKPRPWEQTGPHAGPPFYFNLLAPFVVANVQIGTSVCKHVVRFTGGFLGRLPTIVLVSSFATRLLKDVVIRCQGGFHGGVVSVSLLLFREEQVAKCFWMIRRRPESMVLAAP